MSKGNKRSFFERLTGGIKLSEHDEPEAAATITPRHIADTGSDPWKDEEPEGELALDVYQTPTDICVQTFVAGVKPDDLEINITRDMLTIRGKRQESRTVHEGDFFSRELYWGAFSRTISLPAEVEPDEADAIERHGLLTIRVPKIDKNKKSNLKVKSV
jgi:HSP20 family molecular chaperone IbpA